MIRQLKDNEKVFVNDEKKCVTVTSTIDDWVTLNMIDSSVLDYHPDKFERKFRKYFDKPVTFVGIARMFVDENGVEDDYDVQLATNVAESKMERQFHQYLVKCLKQEIHEEEVRLNELSQTLDQEYGAIESVTSHIIDITSKGTK